MILMRLYETINLICLKGGGRINIIFSGKQLDYAYQEP